MGAIHPGCLKQFVRKIDVELSEHEDSETGLRHDRQDKARPSVDPVEVADDQESRDQKHLEGHE